MKHITILFFLSMILIPFNHAFAHDVTEFYGVGGCPVNSCGITDWDSLNTVSNGMFYVSLVVYSVIALFVLYSLYKRDLLQLKL